MPSRSGGPPLAAGKKQVRFSRPLQRLPEEEEEDEDEDEETLFENRRRLREEVGPGPGVTVIQARGRASGRAGRCVDTFLLCGAFLGLGMSIAILGPTFKELATNVNKNLSEISYIFVGRSLGYVGGSLIGGILFDYANPYLLIGISMLMTSLGMYTIPWCSKAVILTGLMSLVGISMGFLDTGGNLLILLMWGTKVGPYMQALHFSFALGAFVAPILAKPLLGTLQKITDNSGNGILNNTKISSHSNLVDFMDVLKTTVSAFTPFTWAYIVIGSFVLLISVLFFIIYLRSSPNRSRAAVSSQDPPFARYHNVILFLLFFFFFWYVGAEVAYGSYIFTYAKDFVHFDDNQAAGLNSLFWGTFATGRGLAIFLATCLYPGTMILLSLIGCTISSIILTLHNTNLISLWVGTGLYGASMAATFPSGVSWIKQYTNTTGKSAALFVFGAALGEMVVPALVGFLQGLDTIKQYPILMLTALGTSAMTAILFPVMYKLASSPSSIQPENDDQKALLGSGLDEDENNDDPLEDWNDADFEVIEMSDVKNDTERIPMRAASVKSMDLVSPEHSSFPSLSTQRYLGGSPKKKLFNLEREKND
ncbi:sodium-dependent glucose transporter 1 [Stegostoma tigrinum]|uniref:sodium-dependent glucose transporter 1 n=1 Tax=Stegostoma tigrinum TaxID=3053191 RepID=UPI00202BA32B|nr:sodium-dependent glucose transporter 1 [Stegostoma tigrinum]